MALPKAGQALGHPVGMSAKGTRGRPEDRAPGSGSVSVIVVFGFSIGKAALQKEGEAKIFHPLLHS